jgi:hypothetical protein
MTGLAKDYDTNRSSVIEFYPINPRRYGGLGEVHIPYPPPRKKGGVPFA